MAKLRAQKPDTSDQPRRLKCVVYGEAKAGKSHTLCQVPEAYYIDCEEGTRNPKYQRMLAEAGSVYLPVVSLQEVYDECRLLAQGGHDFKTVIIDPVSMLHEREVNALEDAGHKGVAAYSKAKRESFKLFDLLFCKEFDMNVIVVAHEKISYKPVVQEGDRMMVPDGVKPAGYTASDYKVDLMLRVQRDKISGDRFAEITHSRVEEFPQDQMIPWSFDEFRKRSKRLDDEVVSHELISEDQQRELKMLLDTLSEEEIRAWKIRRALENKDLENLTAERAEKAITYIRNRKLGKGDE